MSRVWIFVILLGIIAFFLLVMFIDDHRFVIREYHIRSEKVSFPLTFVFMSDLHSKDYGDGNLKIRKAVEEIGPDAVLVGGDMIISSKARSSSPDWMKVSLSLMEELTQNCPVFYSNGNHEDVLREEELYRPLYEDYMSELRSRGVRELHNQSVSFKGITLTGLELPHESYRKIFPVHVEPSEIEACVGPCDPSSFHMVLAHNPKFFSAYAAWGADAVLAGHVHGGLMRIGRLGMIAPDLHLLPKYSAGEYTLPGKNGQGTSTMILTCGLGEHTLPIRIFNPAELSLIRLEPAGTT